MVDSLSKPQFEQQLVTSFKTTIRIQLSKLHTQHRPISSTIRTRLFFSPYSQQSSQQSVKSPLQPLDICGILFLAECPKSPLSKSLNFLGRRLHSLQTLCIKHRNALTSTKIPECGLSLNAIGVGTTVIYSEGFISMTLYNVLKRRVSLAETSGSKRPTADSPETPV
jgi:hypothetical protein